jgi:predicted acetyltransferase
VTSSALTARPIADDEFDRWITVCSAAFGGLPEPAHTQLEAKLMPKERMLGAFADDELVGTASDYPFEMTVCGGATIPVAGVTGVGVLATHRRRGALRAMMARQLDDADERGEVAAILNASESSIYERFGYGLAQEYQSLQIDTSRATFDPAPPERRLRLVPKQDATPLLRPIFDAYRVTRPGEVSRIEAWWEALVGDVVTWKGGGPVFVVVAEADGDDPGGYALYEMQNEGLGPMKRIVVKELVAATAATAAALWRYLVEVDLVSVVEMIARPLDDPIRWRLTEPRQLRVARQADYLWVRLLDVERALSARTYDAEGELVVEVDDAMRPQLSGRYRVEGSPKGGACERTDAAPDLALSVAELGAIYLGGMSASRLADAGRIEERQPGALRVADAMFRWRVLPFCATRF